jgi:hypothetical protein
MPFPAEPFEVAVRGERIRIRGNQVIIWLTLTSDRVSEPNPSAVPFPAIIDLGHNYSFSILDRHLVEWVGIRPEALPVTGAVRERGQRLLLRAARIWAHANVPGSRDRLADSPPLQISAPRGIAVYPSAGGFPRLPILGLRAIAENELILHVNGRRREASMRTAFRWWPFA